MMGAVMVAYEVGYGGFNPWVGMAVSMIMMWAAFRLIGKIRRGNK